MDKQKAEWPDEKHIESVGQNGGTLEDEGKTLMSELMALADIRQVIGDPHGKLTQDELVSAIKRLKLERDELHRDYHQMGTSWEATNKERDEYRGHLAQICEMLGEMPNGKPDIGAAWEGVAAVIAHQDRLVHELSACQRVLHALAHHGQVTPDYANDAKAVIDSGPDISLAEVKAQAIESIIPTLQRREGGALLIGVNDLQSIANRIRQEAQCNN